MLFLISFVIGVILKSFAMQTVTIGFDDFKLDRLKGDYTFLKTTKDKEQQNGAASSGTESSNQESAPAGSNQGDSTAN